MRRAVTTAMCLVILGAVAGAHGEPTTADKAVAEALFQDAKKLFAAGKIDEACEKYGKSHEVAPGGGTVLSLGICREEQGRYASALLALQDALARAKTAKRDDRIKTANEHLAAVEPKVSKLSVSIAAGAEVDGLEVKLDGASVPRVAWGTEVPIDPGTHAVSASAPGKKAWTGSVTIAAVADRKTVTVPKLENDAKTAAVATSAPATTPTAAGSAAPPHAVTAAPSSDGAGTGAPPDTGASTGRSTGRTIGLVVGATGLAVLAVGTYFTLNAGSLDADAQAMGDAGNPEGANEKKADARNAQRWGRIGLGVGGALLVSGAVLYLVSPPTNARSSAWLNVIPSVGATGGSLTLVGRF